MVKNGYSISDTRACKQYLKSAGFDPAWIDKAEYRKWGLMLVMGMERGNGHLDQF
jgi:hypothetical protein